MTRMPKHFPWHAALGLMMVAGLILVSSCESSLRRLRPPYHEPALAPPHTH